MTPLSLLEPKSLAETRVPQVLLQDLAAKILFLRGEMSAVELAQRLCLNLSVIEEIVQFLRKEQLCEVKGMSAGTLRIAPTEHGRKRAIQLLSLSQYTGPAPVSLADYWTRVNEQSIKQADVHQESVIHAFRSLVVEPAVLSQLGTAMVSGTALFLHGPSGTGKTSIAECIPTVYGDSVWIPYAVEVDSQIITVYDSGVHKISDPPAVMDFDKRWLYCQRPLITTSGELELAMLDLRANPASQYSDAPLQMKANNGVLILDDFGRQRIRPEEILNRWMTALDRRVEFLTLPGGKRFATPFDVFVVFVATVDPPELADEAFLRRIPYRIQLSHATPDQFKQIFRQACDDLLLAYDEAVLEHLILLITMELKRPLRHCHPRDLLRQIVWAAVYKREEPQVNHDTIEQACRNYFSSAAREAKRVLAQPATAG